MFKLNYAGLAQIFRLLEPQNNLNELIVLKLICQNLFQQLNYTFCYK